MGIAVKTGLGIALSSAEVLLSVAVEEPALLRFWPPSVFATSVPR